MYDLKYHLEDEHGNRIYSGIYYTEAEHYQQFFPGSEIVTESEEDYWKV